MTTASLWTGHEGSYVTEASTLRDQRVTCPGCDGPVTGTFQIERDAELEVVSWRLTHVCGARLVIFND